LKLGTYKVKSNLLAKEETFVIQIGKPDAKQSSAQVIFDSEAPVANIRTAGDAGKISITLRDKIGNTIDPTANNYRDNIVANYL